MVNKTLVNYFVSNRAQNPHPKHFTRIFLPQFLKKGLTHLFYLAVGDAILLKYSVLVVKRADWMKLSFVDMQKKAVLELTCEAKDDVEAKDYFKALLESNDCGLTGYQLAKAVDTVEQGINTLCGSTAYFVVLV